MGRQRFSGILPASLSFLLLAPLTITGQAFGAFSTGPTRTVGPFTGNQASPAPGGGWQASDDRVIGRGVNGQEGWTEVAFPTRYDNEITTATAHSGTQSWRMSNWFHTGLVQAFQTQHFAAAGQTGATGPGPIASNTLSYSLWLRTVSTTADPNNIVSISASGNDRMTFMSFTDDGTSLTASALQFGGANASATSGPLTRGAWYKMQVDATFNDGADNDSVHYRLFSAADLVNPVLDSTQGSWEPGVGALSVDHLSFRVSVNPDNGDQTPSDTNSVTNRPVGFYYDDLSVSVGGNQVYTTSFEAAAVPEPASLLSLGGIAILGIARRRR
jgi:hypothetical protein